MKILLSTAALLLCVPAAAHARGPVLPPVGASVCTADTCIVLAETDSTVAAHQQAINTSGPPYQQGLLRQNGAYHYDSSRCSIVNLPLGPFNHSPGACYMVPGVHVTWLAKRTHPYRKRSAYMEGYFGRYYSEEGDHPWRVADSLTYRPELNTPDCNPSGENERWITILSDGKFGANADAPEDFRLECGYQRAGQQSTESTESTKPPESTQPAALQTTRCASVTIPRRRVAVTARGMSCVPARTIIARYIARGIEPRGWICVQARAGAARSASCGKAASGRARTVRVSARWRA